MRVVMLSWEFPPNSVGGLGQHVYDLTAALSRQGVEVFLFTLGAPGAPLAEEVNGVRVYRVQPSGPSTPDFTTWVLQANTFLLERAIPVLAKLKGIKVVHAHDWLVAWAARALKHAYRLPLVVTVHATEFGRHRGLHTLTQHFISSVEWWLTYEAWRVIVCSRYMEGEVKYIFQLPADKLVVIPNAVDPGRYCFEPEGVDRNWFAAPDEKIVFFVGRLVWEKGVQVLLRAFPQVLARCPQTKLIIAGTGPYEGELKRLAEELGIAHRVYFTGYLEERVRNALYHWASVAVFPSLYEPFGIVALEAMAAQVPVVVSDVGGLQEIVEDGVDGLKCPPDQPEALAEKITWLLLHPEFAASLSEQAYRKVKEKYSWEDVARRTKRLYEEVARERQRTDWPAPPELCASRTRIAYLFHRYA
ncbi:glycosyl transferase group 1 [Ammonifex degensii KC4]|uniref:Glycosyl transferase group 1 n=1 Tax=Ammonifex degensii (strain DSM 10501 / KC4) TaxID=429009 RepID=C9RCJ7_AMMDK|nr:glycosyl transferase group 1 [Ammonifex degensii KC4]